MPIMDNILKSEELIAKNKENASEKAKEIIENAKVEGKNDSELIIQNAKSEIEKIKMDTKEKINQMSIESTKQNEEAIKKIDDVFNSNKSQCISNFVGRIVE